MSEPKAEGQQNTTKQMLILFSVNQNNNKFYYAELCEDQDEVLVRYGRVGNNGVEHRYKGGLKKFESLLRAKRNKGYKDAMIEETVGESGVEVQHNVIETALNEINYKDDLSKELVKTISSKNVHKITGSTSIMFDSKDGLFKTPLGVIQRTGVEQAINLLAELEKVLPKYLELRDKKPNIDTEVKKGKKRDAGGKVLRALKNPSDTLEFIESKMFDLNEQYFVIIPNKVKNARDIEHLLFSQKAIDEQKATCDALLETLDLIDDLKKKNLENKNLEKSDNTKPPTFSVEIEHVDDQAVFALINQLFESTKNSSHAYYSADAHILKIYKIKLESQHQAFEERKEKKNVNLLWHGTRTQNLLSIMSKGLLLPKLSPGQKAGAMFGDGLYFANQSSKSLNYCDGGLWTQNSNEKNIIYMFLASVNMGNSFVPSGPVSSPPPKGYDSYWAKAGKSGVMNDEIIVFSADQIRLDYILEIERKYS
ncbi:hypothetical protein BB558_000514 [Smittium angustum]|uniref:Poly [ADP-ribose] polymerase n=1 Tax=Smittium angustum TaxID=133377 RepID=A0A2U1JEC3_SMIAN|nr:hypothetical protein BB558_000514 [Smittium angustum]